MLQFKISYAYHSTVFPEGTAVNMLAIIRWNCSTSLQTDGGKIPPKSGYGMVEFFHPLADGGKIPPCW